MIKHEFETTLGDELSDKDLEGASFRVVQTFVDNDEGDITFTHRIELHSTDDQMIDTIRHHLGLSSDTSPEEVKRAIEDKMKEEGNGHSG